MAKIATINFQDENEKKDILKRYFTDKMRLYNV